MLKNKNNKSSRGRQEGIMSLVVIFVVGFFGLGVALTIATIALVGLNKNYNTNSGNQTFYTAETAVKEGAYRYIENYDPVLGFSTYTGGIPPLINNATDTLSEIEIIEPYPVWPYVGIKGTAGNGTTYREITYTLTEFPEGLAFDYAIFSESDISLGGNASTSWKIFSNGTTSINSDSVTMNGDVISAGNITAGSHGEHWNTINGATTTNAEPIPAPQINLDFDEYKTAAENNPAEPGGTVFENIHNLEHYLQNNTRTGVIFASTTNPLGLSSNSAVLNGSIATLGDLTLTNGSFFSNGDYEAVVVAGDFNISGNAIIEGNVYVEGDFEATGGKIKGIIYVKGKTTFGAGSPVIEGALISVGGIDATEFSGHAEIIYNPNILANWASFDGLSTTTASSPRITNWQEQ